MCRAWMQTHMVVPAGMVAGPSTVSFSQTRCAAVAGTNMRSPSRTQASRRGTLEAFMVSWLMTPSAPTAASTSACSSATSLGFSAMAATVLAVEMALDSAPATMRLKTVRAVSSAPSSVPVPVYSGSAERRSAAIDPAARSSPSRAASMVPRTADAHAASAPADADSTAGEAVWAWSMVLSARHLPEADSRASNWRSTPGTSAADRPRPMDIMVSRKAMWARDWASTSAALAPRGAVMSTARSVASTVKLALASVGTKSRRSAARAFFQVAPASWKKVGTAMGWTRFEGTTKAAAPAAVSRPDHLPSPKPISVRTLVACWPRTNTHGLPSNPVA
mmetsp:Transcript_8240/g.32481  ORF Transcript_8240/g.32481 Transcript_8240/m.32481 type:complete len:334 (+) Transcript_8240:1450-2451(+)